MDQTTADWLAAKELGFIGGKVSNYVLSAWDLRYSLHPRPGNSRFSSKAAIREPRPSSRDFRFHAKGEGPIQVVIHSFE